MKRWAVVLLCGWVLWLSGATSAGQRSLESPWGIVAGFESAAECRAAADLLLTSKPAAKGMKTLGILSVGPGSGVRSDQSADGKTTALTHVKCLPAEADPRPRYKE